MSPNLETAGTVSFPVITDTRHNQRFLKFSDNETWESARRKFINMIKNYDTVDNLTGYSLHREYDLPIYTDNWQSAMWSELYERDQRATEEWFRPACTVLITLNGSYWLDKKSERLYPPTIYLEALKQARDPRQKALSRVLDDINKWASIRVRGGPGPKSNSHRLGYPQLYIGLYLSDSVKRSRFRPVIDAHVTHCCNAKKTAHSLKEAVSIMNSPEYETELVHALGKRCPGVAKPMSEEPKARQLMGVALFAAEFSPVTTGQSI